MFSDWDTVKVDIYIHTWPTIFPVQDDPILPLKWSITLHGLVDIAHSWSLPQSKWMFLIVVMQLPQCATCIWSAARTQVQWIWKCKINWLFFVVVSTAFKKKTKKENAKSYRFTSRFQPCQIPVNNYPVERSPVEIKLVEQYEIKFNYSHYNFMNNSSLLKHRKQMPPKRNYCTKIQDPFIWKRPAQNPGLT